MSDRHKSSNQVKLGDGFSFDPKTVCRTGGDTMMRRHFDNHYSMLNFEAPYTVWPLIELEGTDGEKPSSVSMRSTDNGCFVHGHTDE